MVLMYRLFYPLLISITIGCSQQPSSIPPSTSNRTSNTNVRLEKQTAVKDMIAEIMNVPAEQLQNDIPLSEFPTPMDDLDLVELVMELEESELVLIPDRLLIEFSNAKNANTLPQHLTIDTLARILEVAEPMREVPVTLE